MSQSIPTTRFETGQNSSVRRWAIPVKTSVELQQLANYSIAFLTATAVVVDAFRLFSLVYCLVCGQATFDSFAGQHVYGDLVSTPLYALASILGFVVSISLCEFKPALAAGWLVGFAIAIACLLSEMVLHRSASVPCWGLLAFWCGTLCVMTVQEKQDKLGVQHVAFFVVGVFCLTLWGKHGNLELLQVVEPSWQGLDCGYSQSLGSLNWQQALVAFSVGFVVAVVLPCIFVLLMMEGASLGSFGLKIPVVKRREWMFRSMLLLVAGLPIFYVSSANAELQSHYPYVREFTGPVQWVTFELATLLFYACVEFLFRGYILFGVERFINGADRNGGPVFGSAAAILVSAVPYIVWHLDKPTPELVGALVWAIVAGVSAVQYRSVLHLIVIHWLWNVCLDISVLQKLEIGFTG